MRSILLLPLLLAGACSSPEQPATSTPPLADSSAAPLEPLDTVRPATVDAQADTLLTSRSRHVFSAPGTPDVFSLVLRGSSVLSSEAAFTITTAGGEVIFREMLTSSDLEAAMVYEMTGPTATQNEREAYVRKRVQEFFAEKNFKRPAVPKSAIFPGATEAPAGLDRAAWDDLRSRPAAVAFQYLVGKEDRRTVAWSPLRKQVVHLP
ncbi:hypothetical protein ACFPAF_16080 [Hymenobacter endophyticus]|uniref:Lipoprotein n=1 Tax=Hymenobacter endophyticus TaxID=3076335 RepID=A0ABU3TKM5_9BACT|nr:hypothetical protein [Hymenobacter endophyticus]MDU0371920.1 hypothetical protein [Hymenobacter endophyticus]